MPAGSAPPPSQRRARTGPHRRNIGNEQYFDVSAVFRFMDTHDLVVGVNNILDDEAPLVGGSLATNANAIAGFWDTLGRYMFADVTFRW
jgi:hypothetical protein